jgi:hypothetical protein
VTDSKGQHDETTDPGVTALGFVVAVGSAACENKGPMQKAGEKIDRATDQDKAIGKGPLEKAGKSVDAAASLRNSTRLPTHTLLAEAAARTSADDGMLSVRGELG